MSLFRFIKKRKEKVDSHELDPRIIDMKRQIEEIINKSLIEDRYSVYSFDVSKDILRRCEEQNSFEKYEWFCSIIDRIDRKCTLSQETGEMINRLMSDSDNYLAIHRGYLGRMDYIDGVAYNEKIDDIIHNGLIDYGAELQGMHSEYPSISQTCSKQETFGDLANLFNSYNDNNVIVLLRFPKNIVENDLYVSKENYEEIFTIKEKKKYIKPEFIIGMIVKEGKNMKYYSKDELLNVNNDKKEYN